MSFFTNWINEFITPGEPQEILPGRRVHLGVQATPVGLTADQALEMASRLIACATVPGQPVMLFADGREPTTNERHLANLLSWRTREAKQNKEEIDVLREQLAVATDRAQSWKNIAENRATKADHELVGYTPR